MSDPKHLSETGCFAGRRLCQSNEGESVHAVYAPLANPDFRDKCCKQCLKVWASEAYVDGDEMPDWVFEMWQAPSACQSA